MPGKPADPNAMHGPNQDRRTFGVVEPERPAPADPASDTPEQDGIEIDHHQERPHDD